MIAGRYSLRGSHKRYSTGDDVTRTRYSMNMDHLRLDFVGLRMTWQRKSSIVVLHENARVRLESV